MPSDDRFSSTGHAGDFFDYEGHDSGTVIPSAKNETKTKYVQHRLREGWLLPKILIMAFKPTRRACKHWFFSSGFLRAIISRHLEYNAPAVIFRMTSTSLTFNWSVQFLLQPKMAADFQRFTHFRPCIDLHDGKVKQVCFKKKLYTLFRSYHDRFLALFQLDCRWHVVR